MPRVVTALDLAVRIGCRDTFLAVEPSPVPGVSVGACQKPWGRADLRVYPTAAAARAWVDLASTGSWAAPPGFEGMPLTVEGRAAGRGAFMIIGPRERLGRAVLQSFAAAPADDGGRPVKSPGRLQSFAAAPADDGRRPVKSPGRLQSFAAAPADDGAAAHGVSGERVRERR